jgi:hypothetical protein
MVSKSEVVLIVGGAVEHDLRLSLARLIVVNDKQGGRLVSNVDLIPVRSAP